MASYLRSLVAGPRKGHPEAGLDLCYVTDYIIATSGPSHTYPRRAYRNPLDSLVAFLDAQHGADWAIWEFRAEGTGYPDALAHDRVLHFPFPDHHPPPFALMPRILASMRHWLYGGDLDGTGAVTPSRHPKRVVVVHCKAGKGRSGTASVSYMVAEEGWTAEDALARFTERRMRPRFGAGVSIPSQLRWVSYVDRWTANGKAYTDRPIEIVEIHVWGLRNGVKVDVEGFAEDGRKIQSLHTFKTEERHIVQGDAPSDGSLAELVWDMAGLPSANKAPADAAFASATNNADASASPSPPPANGQPPTKTQQPDLIPEHPTQPTPAASAPTPSSSSRSSSETEPGGMAVIFRPATPIRVPHSDVNIAVERRHRTHKRIGLTAVSAVAHVWFNAFFEGRGGPEQGGQPKQGGVFTIAWDAMDGIRGMSRKGTRGLDKMSVVWRFVDDDAVIEQPVAAPDEVHEKDLGMRLQSPASADISRASSVRTVDLQNKAKGETLGAGGAAGEEDAAVRESVKTSDPAGAELRPEETKSVA